MPGLWGLLQNSTGLKTFRNRNVNRCESEVNSEGFCKGPILPGTSLALPARRRQAEGQAPNKISYPRPKFLPHDARVQAVMGARSIRRRVALDAAPGVQVIDGDRRLRDVEDCPHRPRHGQPWTAPLLRSALKPGLVG